MVAPIGSTISLISFGTFIFSVAIKFTGKVAIELPVARDVTAGVKIFLKKILVPSLPPAQ